MLTSDLLRVRRQAGVVQPRYLNKAQKKRLAPVAAQLCTIISAGVGERRETLEQSIDEVAFKPTDRIVVAGLQKLLLNRCEFDMAEGIDPIALRETLFRRASERRRALEPGERLDRDALVAEVAGELDCDAPTLERRMFADLRGEAVLLEVRPLDPEALLRRYDVALAQSVLLRATRVVIELDSPTPGEARQLFRAARFHGLLHEVVRTSSGYRVQVDGPFSLFSAVQKYGFKLALFLPAVLRCRAWTLRADLLWGKQRKASRFELDPSAGLTPNDTRVTGVAPQLDVLCEAFDKLGSAWRVAPSDTIFALPGEAVCVPDLVFENVETGEQVFLEAFGFWSRAAVWQRVETLSKRRADDGGLPPRIILAVGKQLRVSEDVLEDDAPGELYVYKRTMSARAILKRLEAAG